MSRLLDKEVSKLKYTRLERLDIGRQVYYNELSDKAAAEKYGLSPITVMNYARFFRDENNLPRKPIYSKKKVKLTPKVKNPVKVHHEPNLEEYQSMSKDELIQELIAARITEARLKKGYQVKGVGPEKEFIPLGNKSTK